MNWGLEPTGWLRALALSSVVVGAAWGCQLDSGGLGDQAPPVAKGEVASKAGEQVCAWFFQCSCDDFEPDRYTSEEQCANQVEARVQAAIDEADAAELEYDPTCAGQVLETYEGLSCDTQSEQWLHGLIALGEDLQCKLFFGEAEVGQSCTSMQLSDGDTCVRDAECVDGACQAIEAPPGPGEACDAQTLCGGGAWCVQIEANGALECQLLPGETETCLGEFDWCDVGLTCKQTNKTCQLAPSSGQQCASTPWACGEGLYCHSSDKCVALPPEGEACADVPNGFPLCAEGLTCDQGSCVREPAMICSLGPAVFLGWP